MKILPYKIQKASVGALASVYLTTDEDILSELGRDVLDTLSTDLEVTIGETTMFLAAWLDPEHWSEDWAEKLGCEDDDVDAQVRALIEDAIEEKS